MGCGVSLPKPHDGPHRWAYCPRCGDAAEKRGAAIAERYHRGETERRELRRLRLEALAVRIRERFSEPKSEPPTDGWCTEYD